MIPTLESETLAQCLKFARQALAGVSHEIIVVTDHGFGVSEARNRGLAKASGRYFILIDDDCFIESSDLIHQVMKRAQSQDCLHGGTYALHLPASYWAQVYSIVNKLWLELGREDGNSQTHLLGGFLFGSKLIKSQLYFDSQLKWGGEEKKLLLRLATLGIEGLLHQDLPIRHVDPSGFGKMLKRAFYQGLAAGYYDLHTKNLKIQICRKVPIQFLPGLGLFYLFSRLGIFFGKLKSILHAKTKEAESSPVA